MGRAVVRNPAVFLFDEPLSNLDAKLRVQMRSEIKALHQKVGTTSIYVTHDQIEAMTLADRIVVLNAGRIEQEGSPAELYKTPANRFVASFIGSPAMNQLDAVIEAADGAPVAMLSDGTRLDLAPGRRVRSGQRVTVGIRPEHMAPGQGGENPISGRTILVEPTGAQAHVMFELAGEQVMAIVDGDFPVRSGETFAANVARPQVHVFDADSGLSL
jgi:multiple sugar transport system ATP-binding protein